MTMNERTELYWLCENVGIREAFLMKHDLPTTCSIPVDDLENFAHEVYQIEQN